MSIPATPDLRHALHPDGTPCSTGGEPTTSALHTAGSAPGAWGDPTAGGARDSGANPSRQEPKGSARSGVGGIRGADAFRRRVRRSFGRGAAQYDQEALLQQAMAWRLARLCSDLVLPEGPCADLGAGTGLLSRALRHHHQRLRLRPPLQLDLCPELLARNPLATGPGHPRAPEPPIAPGPPIAPEPLLPPKESAADARLPEGRQLHANDEPLGRLWNLDDGLPEELCDAALLASSFALQWLQEPARALRLWCRSLAPGGWLVLAVPTAGSFPQWRDAAAQAGVPCTALPLPDADALREAAEASGLQVRHARQLRFSRPRQGGLRTLRHLQRLGAGANRGRPLSPGQLRRLLAHWPAATPLTWEVLLLIGQRRH